MISMKSSSEMVSAYCTPTKMSRAPIISTCDLAQESGDISIRVQTREVFPNGVVLANVTGEQDLYDCSGTWKESILSE